MVRRPPSALEHRESRCGGRGVGQLPPHALVRSPSALEVRELWCGGIGGCRPRSRGGERGGATVFACVALVGLIAAALVIGQVGTAVVARHRAQAGADLAALAAAGALDGGAEAGCEAGEEVVRRMGMRISECRVDGWDATVTVARNIPMGLFGTRTVHAVARAGPVEEEV
ncbi:Rv3654c family TadE-like protein [Nocardia lijiangensis]|uniref:Rv3654c family TadE-like protein n=1 Tax=Nocardia lijiangensis TaxID=299618 RepID=UPI0009FF69ED|nr:Rv3654c family TadE-like protein [Nocardia lijiangensis]